LALHTEMGDDDWAVCESDPEIDEAFTDTEEFGCIPKLAEDMKEGFENFEDILAGKRQWKDVLVWKNEFGRRPPTPKSTVTVSHQQEQETPSNIDTSGFDFDDESSTSSLHNMPRKLNTSATPKGNTKKKQTTFDSILNNVRRQKKMEFKENFAAKKKK